MLVRPISCILLIGISAGFLLPGPLGIPDESDDAFRVGGTFRSMQGRSPMYTTEVTSGAEKTGAISAPGIKELQIQDIVATNYEIASMYAIVEQGAKGRHGHIRNNIWREFHGDGVRRIACYSHATCRGAFLADPPFQFRFGSSPPGRLYGWYLTKYMRDMFDSLPRTVKLVSTSFSPARPSELYGPDLPFASIEAVGNYGVVNFFDSPENKFSFLSRLIYGVNRKSNILSAISADRVLFVAGYDPEKVRREGVYERHPNSTGCGGIERGCIWAPYGFTFRDGNEEYRYVGTSGSAPHVASALASVLAISPKMSGTDLIRLAKACAIPTPGLPGLGRVDFTCLHD